MNKTLEQIAQTIFKSWFVDFEPVKSKIEAKATNRDPERAAMCVISGKSEPELDQLSPEQYQQLASTAALFPDEMMESELGLIPIGWKVATLGEMVQLIGGGTPKRSNIEFWGGDIPWFSVKDAPADGDVFVVDTKEKITKDGLEKSTTRLLPVGTVIISARGTVGRLAFVGEPMGINQSCYGVEGVDGVGPYFNYFNLKEAVSALQQNTHGAVFDTITRQTFETVTCIRPKNPLLERFEMILAPMMRTICNNVLERGTLVTMRDVLLPKLLSGELGIVATNILMEETA
jgi:type I restriction enzyme S subunit